MIGRCSVQLVLRGSRTTINDKRVSFHPAIIWVQSVLAIYAWSERGYVYHKQLPTFLARKAASVGFVPATRNACRILLSVTTWDAVVVEDLEALCVELDVQCIE